MIYKNIRMEELMKQVPEGLSYEIVEKIYIKNEKDFMKTMMEVWNIPESTKKEMTKWEEIRDTCDSFDEEMAKVMKGKRQNQ